MMWMFKDHPDQDADVTMMLEMRSELADWIKGAEKLGGVKVGPATLQKGCTVLKQAANDAKAGMRNVVQTRQLSRSSSSGGGGGSSN